MDIDGGALLASLLVSGVGYVFFRYGRKMQRAPQIAGGLVLMVFPYFVSSALWMLFIAALIVLLVWLALRLGY